MSDNKGVRLAKVALEINVGIETIAEHLKKRGFEVDPRPTTKLTEEMYAILLKDFRAEKNLKEKAEQISLRPPKKEDKKEDEQEIVLPKTSLFKEVIPSKEPIATVETPIVTEIEPKLEVKLPIVPIEPSTQTIVQKEETPIIVEKIIEPEKITTIIEEKQEEPKAPIAKIEETPINKKHTQTTIIKKDDNDGDDDDDDNDDDNTNTSDKLTEKKLLPGTTVVGKIDIDKLSQDAIDKATAAKKEKRKRKREREKAKKEREKAEKTTTVAPIAIEKPRLETKTSQIINEDKGVIAEPEKEISKIEAPKLGGLKILGKIDIVPIEEEEKDSKKQKRKRKRIVKDKRVAIEDPAKTASVDGKVERRKPTDNKDGKERDSREKSTDKKHQSGNKTAQGGAQNKTGASTNNRPNDPNKRNDNNKNQPVRKRTDNSKLQAPAQPTLVSEKEIQDQMRATMARMAGGSAKAKGDRVKNRKLKREQHAERRAEEAVENSVLQVTEFISVSELAKLMNISITEIITTCFSLGMMVTINYRLDAELIEVVANEFGFEVEFVSATEQDEADAEIPDAPEDLKQRPPIVTIMGHVDHGKTSLLDYIRNANVVAGEVGGITQHIGAYSVELKDGREITFLDTPGHEAFTAMRARGAKVTDIAIIVIAADDTIMKQTEEAISHAQAANVPMVFAINKIDKPGANPEKVKEQLAQRNILVEDWGGTYQSQEISAKKGINIDLLLEKILLQAEMLELKANPIRRGIGTVIEASLDKGKGYVSTILVQNGTINIGDPLLAGQYFGKIKAMFNERGAKIKSAGPSQSVLVLGLNGAPQAGDKVRVTESEQDARTIALKREQLLREQQQRTQKHITLEEIGRRLALGNFKELNLIIKADFDGSVEAIADALLKLSTEEVQVRIIHRSVGAITEGDVLLASASDAIIIGFQVRPTPKARKQAEQENIDIRLYSIIYNAIEEVKQAMEGLLEPTIEEKFVCNIEVRDVFKITKAGTIAGCYVQEGKVFRDTKVRLVRDGVVMYTGSIDSLKRFKDDMKEVQHGMECGISLKNFSDIKVGDFIEGYEEIAIKRKL